MRHGLDGRGRFPLRAVTGALLCALLITAFAATATASAHNGKVLILETTVEGGSSSREAQAAEEAGQGVEVASPAQWEALTTAQFEEYDAVILGDPTCETGEAALAAPDANSATWNAAIGGNVIVIGTDPNFHSIEGIEGAKQLIKSGVAFAVENTAATGAYIDLSCYYALDGAETHVPMLDHMSEFGTFEVFGQDLFSACPEESHIVASSPALSGLTDEALSHWECSAHEAFEHWPADFEVLAINKNIGTNYTASDGTVGGPYILSRGARVISNISLTPETAKNPLGAPHTLTATVTEGGQPVVGTTVTFTVIAGPNEGVTGTGVTNSEGIATFTYTSSKPGTDVIHATFVDAAGRTETSNTAEKTWEEEVVKTEECTIAKGIGHLGVRGQERLNEDNSLNVAGKPHIFIIKGMGLKVNLTKITHATCTETAGSKEFSGEGNAKVNGVPGYTETLAFEVNEGSVYMTAVVEKEGVVVLDVVHQKLNKHSHENIS